MKLYRDFTTTEEIDAEYNVLGNVPDPEAIIAAWVERSEAAMARLDCRLAVPLRADPCRAQRHLPRRPGRARCTSSSTAATGAASRPATMCSSRRRWSRPAVATVVVNYALCPTVSTRRDRAPGPGRASPGPTGMAREFGADPNRLTISGHSAGGHLVAMALETDWQGVYGLPADMIKGAVAISGALRPRASCPTAMCSPRSRRAGTRCGASARSAICRPAAPPLLVAVGGDETGEFRRQSRDFHAAWQGAGLPGS